MYKYHGDCNLIYNVVPSNVQISTPCLNFDTAVLNFRNIVALLLLELAMTFQKLFDPNNFDNIIKHEKIGGHY